jgi:hypothetical protein
MTVLTALERSEIVYRLFPDGKVSIFRALDTNGKNGLSGSSCHTWARCMK